jgi:hypothetical protein
MCRVYPDKGKRTKREANLLRLYNVALNVTLLVIFRTLYRVHKKCGVLLETSIISHVAAFRSALSSHFPLSSPDKLLVV